MDILPDDILLCIFKVYMNGTFRKGWHILAHGVKEWHHWHGLVQVCRRWRTLVFSSPHHLNVQLLCSAQTPARKLDTWPALPVVVYQHHFLKQKLDNLLAAVKHNDRVCEIDLRSPFEIGQLEKIVSVMEVPFPALTNLKLALDKEDQTVPVLPDLFLGRSAPRLQYIELDGFSFPGLPDLLLSASSLVSLELRRIHHSWYISPDAMVTPLSALTRLKSLILEFQVDFRRPHSDRESRHLPPPPTRTLIPSLTRLKFEGVNEYAEQLLSRFDTPRLDELDMIFFKESYYTVFNVSHLSQFISRRTPKFQAPDEALVAFSDDLIKVTLSFPAPGHKIVLGVLSEESPGGQLRSLTELCRSFLPAFAMVERLYIRQCGYRWPRRWKYGIKHTYWLQLLHLFTNAKDLYISRDITMFIAPTLNELIGERTTEVLPALQNLYFHKYGELTGLAAIEDFTAARELSGHPITVSRWFGW